MNKEIFVPKINNAIFFKSLDLKKNCLFDKKNNFPFFKIKNEDNIINSFLEAIAENKLEEAKKFISKNFLDKIDIHNFKSLFSKNFEYKIINKLEFEGHPKNCSVSSIIFFKKNKKIMNIINLYLVMQPDNFSKWKIYDLVVE